MTESLARAADSSRSAVKGRSALVAGASGLVGRLLLSSLLHDASYSKVKVLTRRPLRQPHSKLVALERTDGAFDRLGDDLATEDVYCCLGSRQGDYERIDYRLVVDLARAARSTGAERLIVVSAAGTSQRSPLHYFRVKARMEAAVAELGYSVVHVVRPSLLLGERKEAGIGERLAFGVAGAMAPLLGGRLKKYRPIEAAHVAGAMIELAKRNLRGVHVHHLPLESRPAIESMS